MSDRARATPQSDPASTRREPVQASGESTSSRESTASANADGLSWAVGPAARPAGARRIGATS